MTGPFSIGRLNKNISYYISNETRQRITANLSFEVDMLNWILESYGNTIPDDQQKFIKQRIQQAENLVKELSQ